MVDRGDEQVKQENSIETLIDSHRELVEKIDDLIDLLKQDINR
jgi:hypothetical protein